MEKALLDIAKQLETVEYLDDRALTKVINRHNKRIAEEAKAVAAAGAASATTATTATHTSPEKTPATAAMHASSKETAAATTSTQSTPAPAPVPTPASASSLAPNTPALDFTGAKINPARPLSKRHLIAYYLDVKRNDPNRWARWNFSEEIQQRIVRTLQMKPRRTASGVATITVLTKPWKCSSNCLYCPNDLRMPKSYLSDEPACQRAERTFFDPYLQVAARIKALTEMGHVTDKVELIILGGTWSDYPTAYQIWFVRELFRALNDGATAQENVPNRRALYEQAGISSDPETLIAQTASLQERISNQELTYNQAFDKHYGESSAWQQVAIWQTATWKELEEQHHINETAQHRVVGLVIETRPERITPQHALTLRRLGCTKVQMGIQSLNTQIREQNDRYTTTEQIQSAFETLRLFGFKTHIHAMVNLLEATPELDKQDYAKLVTDPAFQPDEIKLYPCVLVDGTGLCSHYNDGSWQPYSEQELIDVLVTDTCATPAFTRISRMIRDISAPDIVAGNKKVNLRQLVEGRIDKEGLVTKEIRHREVSLSEIDPDTLHMEIVPYTTTASNEYFLQWVTEEGKIAGFLRLSLPFSESLKALRKALNSGTAPLASNRSAISNSPLASAELPTNSTPSASNTPLVNILSSIPSPGDAMIREVHVYGRVAKLAKQGSGAQHHGLGTQLVEKACTMAREAGYNRINVISAIGTRGYYRKLHFNDNGLYQTRNL